MFRLFAALALLRGACALPNGLRKPPAVHSPPQKPSCSPQKACDFVKALNHPANPIQPAPVSLLCTPEEHCTISGTQLGAKVASGAVGVAGAVDMANVLVENNTVSGWPGSGALLSIFEKGSVNATNVTWRNGHSSSYGGCVDSLGDFTCTDCLFENCHADAGGGVNTDGGHLKLVSSFSGQFANGSCGGTKPCGAGCVCIASEQEASKCVGCTCYHTGQPHAGFWGCESH